MAYRVKPDHDQTLSASDAFDPQPRCEGLQFTRVTPVGDDVVLEGAYFVLQWDVFEAPTEYQAALTKNGLSSVMSREVTVTGPDINYNEVTYNAVAHKPIPGQDISRNNFFLRNGGILYTNLTQL